MAAVGAALVETLSTIEAFQYNNNERVRKIVQDFLPKDFRATMVAHQHEKGEKARKAEVEKLLSKGGTIEDKYNLLWSHQMARREKLAALGNAKVGQALAGRGVTRQGVWKAIIKMISGVPSVLLNFIKTINDENGPIEEMRLKFAPNLYVVRQVLNDIHIAIVLLLGANTLSGADTAEIAKLIADTAEEVKKETAAYLRFLADVMYSAPWFVTASDLAAQNAAAGGGVSSDSMTVRRPSSPLVAHPSGGR